MTWPKVKTVLLRRLRLKESWVIFFILGIIMMNYPFISIFNKPVLFFGLPVLYLYLLFGWLFSIFIIFLFSKAISLRDGHDDRGDSR